MTDFPITHKLGGMTTREELEARIETMDEEIRYIYSLLKSICDFVGMGYVEEVIGEPE